ncbi:MAG TPA: hypothetical protein VE890_02265 [Thermoguttaceae bacterium]|nr:hypothetical protein [Thermoguttaceae bacterium]
MTLQPYGPKKLDQFALQVLDVAAMLREMANSSREHGISDLALHDKKAQEWCDRLHDWTHKAQAELDVKIRQSRARRRTQAAGE